MGPPGARNAENAPKSENVGLFGSSLWALGSRKPFEQLIQKVLPEPRAESLEPVMFGSPETTVTSDIRGRSTKRG